MRSELYETQWLDNLVKESLRRHGVDTLGYATAVQSRLAIGAQRYGDSDFMSKDVIRELLEETPDVGAYALLETQKLNLGDSSEDGVHHALFECALAGAQADYWARTAARLLVAP